MMKRPLIILILFALSGQLLSADPKSSSLSDEAVKSLVDAINLSQNLSKIQINTCEAGVDRSVTERFVTDFMGNKLKISCVSEEYIQEIFSLINSKDYIPFKYPEDGCYARAEEMARIMDKRGITSCKTFIEGDLRVETENSPKGFVEWWYHVAPIVMVRDKFGKESIYVIDPSIFNRPVPVDEWYNIQTKHLDKQKCEKYCTSRYAYYPRDKDQTRKKYVRWDLKDTKSTMKKYLKIQKEREKNKSTEQKL